MSGTPICGNCLCGIPGRERIERHDDPGVRPVLHEHGVEKEPW